MEEAGRLKRCRGFCFKSFCLNFPLLSSACCRLVSPAVRLIPHVLHLPAHPTKSWSATWSPSPRPPWTFFHVVVAGCRYAGASDAAAAVKAEPALVELSGTAANIRRSLSWEEKVSPQEDERRQPDSEWDGCSQGRILLRQFQLPSCPSIIHRPSLITCSACSLLLLCV